MRVVKMYRWMWAEVFGGLRVEGGMDGWKEDGI